MKTSNLSELQLTIIKLYSHGLHTKEICLLLDKTETYIHHYTRTARKTLNATNIIHLVAICVRNKWV